MNPSAPNNQSPFANISSQEPAANVIPQTSTNPAPNPIDEPPVVTPSPKGNSKNKTKILAGILGIIVLTGGIIAGVILLKQNQNPQRQAASCSDWCTSPQDCANAGGIQTTPCSFEFCDPGLVACTLDTGGGETPPDSGQCSVTFPGGVTGSIVISSSCGSIPFNAYYRKADAGTTDGDCVGTNENSLGVKNLGPGTHNPRDYGPGGCGWCVQLDSNYGGSAQYTGDCPTPTATPTTPPAPTPTAPPVSNPTPTPTTTPTPTFTPTIAPTATPTIPPGSNITAMCLDVRAYDIEWNSLTINDLSLLSPGDSVRFSVRGNSSDNGINKARFSLNGNTPIETTKIKPGTNNEYYQEFTLPDIPEDKESLTISIKAELFHPILNMWF